MFTFVSPFFLLSFSLVTRITTSHTHTHIAVGTDLDHKIKAAAAEGEPQWTGLGEDTGVKVWRIEQFRVVPWPENQFGSFHTGDSYVVLNSYQKEGSDAIFHDIHIWIGKESSQDEYGTAAYKMVEADESLGGAAIQHREVQGHESSLFRSYFSSPLKYLEGGTTTGFHHVEATVDAPHLYRVKGTAHGGMSLQQLPLTKLSLNKGDSFILFANKSTVWVWHGETANPNEKAKANALAENMCTEGTVTVLDQGEGNDDVDGGNEAFWNFLGDGEVAEADDADATVEEFTPLLFKLGGAGEAPVQVAQGEPVPVRFRQSSPKIPRSALDVSDIFLLDSGWELFVWMGPESDRSEKLSAISCADVYCQKDRRTADLPLTLIKAGYETSTFADYFFD